MTAMQQRLSVQSTPVLGVPFAPGEALPAPKTAPEQVVTVTHPTDEQEHNIQIFSSRDSGLGNTVTTYAQKLHTDVYLENGLISPSELNALDVFVDKYSNRSTHYYVKNGSKVAAARMVHASKKEGGVLSLPTAEHFEVDAAGLAEVAGVRTVADIKSSEAVEISGLVARKQEGGDNTDLGATMTLYSRMMRDSLEQGHKLWLANVEKGFLRYLSFMAGRKNVKVLGAQKEYMGPATMPVALNPQQVIRDTLQATGPGSDMKKAYLKEVLSGVDDEKIPADLRALLRGHGIPTKEYSPIKRTLKNPKTLGYAAIMAYSSARALPASGVDEFQGSTPMLWGIDVATAVPYTWGIVEAATGKTLPRRALGAVAATTSFAAPYVYFAANGENYPRYVNAAIGGFIGLAVVKETVSRVLRSGKNKQLEAALASSDLPNYVKPAAA